MSKAICNICGKKFSERGINRHLKTCLKKQSKHTDTGDGTPYFRVHIKDRYRPEFWMHLLVHQEATYELLDDFLRGIWLECCGHLSAFRFGHYSVLSYVDDMYGRESDTMEVPLKKMFSQMPKFEYTYDFGSSTDLLGQVIDVTQVSQFTDPIVILSRNEKPKWADCNSPRCGVCAYEEDKTFDPRDLKLANSKPGGPDYLPEEMGVDNLFDDEFEEAFELEFRKELFKSMTEMEKKIAAHLKPLKSLALKDLLKNQSLQSLKKIAKNFSVGSVNKYKKAELINYLALELPKAYTEKMETFLPEQLHALKHLVTKSNGVEGISLGLLNGLTHMEEYFSDMLLKVQLTEVEEGYDIKFYMAEEISGVLNSYDWSLKEQIIKENGQWHKLTEGLLYCYGMMTFDEIVYELNKVLKKAVDPNRLEKVLQFNFVRNTHYAFFDGYYVREEIIESPGRVEAIEDQWQMRRELPKKRFSKVQLLKGANEQLLSKDVSVKTLIKLFKETYEISSGQAEEMVYGILSAFDYEVSPAEIAQDIYDELEMDDLEIFHMLIEMISVAYNHHRQWELKGYAPSEIEKVMSKKSTGTVQTVDFKKKIGRNAPCPCGSGKKYKRCCGR